MATSYTINNTEPWTYLDGLRNPVNGYRVTFNLTQYNETHSVNVKTLAAQEVGKAIAEVVAQRDALAKL